MPNNISLTADDGHQLGAYERQVEGSVGGIVVLQEIFGVNSHIRSVTDRFADLGYSAIAPALFDRQTVDFQSGYSSEEIEAARPLLNGFDWETAVLDVKAAVDHLSSQGLKVSVVGFCLGGSLAYLSAIRMKNLTAAVCYYGGYITKIADETPNCPTVLHYGEHDHTISMEDVAHVTKMRADIDIHTYDAGHGFNCDARGSYNKESADLAWTRSVDVIAKAMNG
ncbi:MAG: carboxymethylenebutenolidase [Hyphomicrobiales bacterium]|nr:MAG: carboxymethylenebutenolidase [Hyphomicrobiales bacterium]